MRNDLAVEARGSKACASAGMLQDETAFAAVQLGIDRHRRKPGMPDAEHQLEVIGRVLGDDRDAVAGLECSAQCAGEPRGALGDFSVGLQNAGAVADGRPAGMAFSRALEPQRQIHEKPSGRTIDDTGPRTETTFGPNLSSVICRLSSASRAEPAEMHRKPLAREQGKRLVQRQADDVGVGADYFHHERAGQTLDRIGAGFPAPLAGGEIGL